MTATAIPLGGLVVVAVIAVVLSTFAAAKGEDFDAVEQLDPRITYKTVILPDDAVIPPYVQIKNGEYTPPNASEVLFNLGHCAVLNNSLGVQVTVDLTFHQRPDTLRGVGVGFNGDLDKMVERESRRACSTKGRGFFLLAETENRSADGAGKPRLLAKGALSNMSKCSVETAMKSAAGTASGPGGIRSSTGTSTFSGCCSKASEGVKSEDLIFLTDVRDAGASCKFYEGKLLTTSVCVAKESPEGRILSLLKHRGVKL